MRLDITWRNIEPTDAISERATRKFEKIAKHLREPVEAHMVIRQEKHRYDAELTVKAAGSQSFAARESTDDCYATVDGVVNKLERTVRRHRERLIDRSHHGDEPLDGFTDEVAIVPPVAR